MKTAAKEEKRLAIERVDFHQGVQVSVWSVHFSAIQFPIKKDIE